MRNPPSCPAIPISAIGGRRNSWFRVGIIPDESEADGAEGLEMTKDSRLLIELAVVLLVFVFVLALIAGIVLGWIRV